MHITPPTPPIILNHLYFIDERVDKNICSEKYIHRSEKGVGPTTRKSGYKCVKSIKHVASHPKHWCQISLYFLKRKNSKKQTNRSMKMDKTPDEPQKSIDKYPLLLILNSHDNIMLAVRSIMKRCMINHIGNIEKPNKGTKTKN